MALRVVFPTKSSGAADRCAREILETVPLVMRVVRSEMRRQGALVVSVPQFRALAFVERLVRRRLVGRVPDPEERRRVVLSLTPAGGRLFARLRARARRQVAIRLAGASASDLRKVTVALAVLDRLFREEARVIG